MMKKISILKKASILLVCLVLLTGVFSLTACGDKQSENVLLSPTDFVYDTVTGDFSFTATDVDTGFYYVRAYSYNPVTDTESPLYVTTSTRLAGASASARSGTLDVSDLGWGQYKIKLISFAAAGLDKTACDPVVIDCVYGLDGKLEKPEYRWSQDGTRVAIELDWYALRDWYRDQYLPLIDFTFYSDAACTTVVKTELIDTMDLLKTMDHYHGSEYSPMWGLSYNRYEYTFSPGTYYFKMKLRSTVTGISLPSESEVSTIVVDAKVTSADATFTDEEKKELNGITCATYGTTSMWVRFITATLGSGDKFYVPWRTSTTNRTQDRSTAQREADEVFVNSREGAPIGQVVRSALL